MIYWGTARLGEAVARRCARLPVPPDLLAHTSPHGREHILPTGASQLPTR
ncbi:hypothetical protein [Palleronia aestuarii]|nr:hypothetical protein [Palleronia aestuarii]